MLIQVNEQDLLNKALQKPEGKITRAEAKAVHGELPPGGVWRTIRGHHVYIVNGKVVAGSLPWTSKKGETKAKKMTRAHLKEAQAHIDKEAGKAEAKEEKPKKAATKKSPAAKKTTAKKTAPKAKRTDSEEKPKKKTTTKKTETKKPVPEEKPKKTTTKKTAKKTKKEIADIRTEAQKNREVAYDVGEKIGGARKDLVVEQFKKAPNLSNLAELEKLDPKLAHKWVTKQTFLPKMDETYLHKQYQSGVELLPAMFKMLIYGRVASKPEEDTPEGRMKYVSAIQRLQDIFEPIKSWDELKRTVSDLSYMMTFAKRGDEKWKENIKRLEETIKQQQKELNAPVNPRDTDKPWYWKESVHGEWTDAHRKAVEERVRQSRKTNLEENKRLLKQMKSNIGIDFNALGESFRNLVKSRSSFESSLRTVEKKLKGKRSWDEYLSEKDKAELEGIEKRKQKAKEYREKWKRIVPEKIRRIGGKKVTVKKPEELMKTFGFRGVEFGHWVNDEDGKFHLQKSAEALQDLSDILGLSPKDVSFHGKLAMAFGARGKGGSLAHYEPEKKVINITKEGGSGSLAHEWAHALDNLIWEHSHDFSRGAIGYASEGNHGKNIDPGVAEAYKNVMEAIKTGDAVMEIPRDGSRYYYIPSHYKDAYEEAGGDLGKAVSNYLKGYRERMNARWEKQHNMLKQLGADPKTIAKQLKKHLNTVKKEEQTAPQVIAFHHESQTGEKVSSIPVPTGESEFYMDARMRETGDSMRRSFTPKYWASDRELFARAFEAFVQDELEKAGRRNDYLVCGTKPASGVKGATESKRGSYALSVFLSGYPYPEGKERERINNAMRYLMKKIRESKSVTKALQMLELHVTN